MLIFFYVTDVFPELTSCVILTVLDVVCCVFVTHGELRQRRRHADGGQEDVGGRVAARQSAEQVVAEVRGSGAHLGLRGGEELHMFLLSTLLTSCVRLEQINTDMNPGKQKMMFLVFCKRQTDTFVLRLRVRSADDDETHLKLSHAQNIMTCEQVMWIPEPHRSSARLQTPAGKLFASSWKRNKRTEFLNEPQRNKTFRGTEEEEKWIQRSG